jgi:hypothetical protein
MTHIMYDKDVSVMASIYISTFLAYCKQNYKYRPYTVKHNSITDFIKLYFLQCFIQRHVSALVIRPLEVD